MVPKVFEPLKFYCIIQCSFKYTVYILTPLSLPGRVAQSVGHLTRNSEVLGSIPGLATYFRFSFRGFKRMCTNRLGGLSLPRKSVVRLTDRPDMTLDVYRGRKTTQQQQQPLSLDVSGRFEMYSNYFMLACVSALYSKRESMLIYAIKLCSSQR